VKYALPHLKIYSLHKASISLGNIERGRQINADKGNRERKAGCKMINPNGGQKKGADLESRN